VKIYKLTRSFPLEEKYGLVNQVRRAAVSISSNIAEGSGRITSKDQAYFYSIAYSSLMELLNQLLIVDDLGWITNEDLLELRSDLEIISIKINRLRKVVLNIE
jgi:four helix bundle protein